MAHQLVTQVSRDGTPAKAPDAGGAASSSSATPAKPSLIDKLCFCCPFVKNKNAAASGGGGGAAASNASQRRSRKFSEPVPAADALLPPQAPELAGKKLLVLDLDETLVHSSFKPVSGADLILPVEIEDTVHQVYVLKRPGVDEFMLRMGQKYEICVFTASLSKYANPLMDQLDIHNVCHHRLFREHCVCHRGNYVKDMRYAVVPISIVLQCNTFFLFFNTFSLVTA